MSATGLRRLYYQRITHPHFTNAAEVVSWLGAMQGQDYLGTLWAFGLRLHTSTETAIEQAITEGKIMRTWAVRGTLFFVAPADIHWMLGLIAPRQITGNAGRYRELELDEPTLIRSVDLIARALDGGKHLTRTELFDILQAEGISTKGQRGFHLLQRAGLERLVYQGEMRGKDTTFHSLAAGKTLPPEEAAAELARRYFTSRGPVTLADFAHWAGLPITAARAALHAVKSQLVEEIIDGQSYWLSPDAHQPPQKSVYLLPGFDEFILGYKDRSVVLDPAFADAICPGGNGVFKPTIISGGRVVGTWKRTLKKATVEITLEPFSRLTGNEMDVLTAAAAEYGAFLGREAVVHPVT